MPRIEPRPCADTSVAALRARGIHPVLARVYAARGIERAEQLDTEFAALHPVETLKGAEGAAVLLAEAIAAGRRMLIVADYDSDGATACALGMRALGALGARVGYVVPNRFEFGYGLSPEIVRLARDTRGPELLITVDNGIASCEGVEEANRLGMRVVITDHHLPGEQLPAAAAIVNPNQPGCGFPSKNLAGVGVMFYLMLALRAELRRRGAFASRPEPNLAQHLDLVALGTVADVVRLDDNNRVLVAQGLKRIRAGKASPGVSALLRAGGRDPARASTYDLGFVAGPRLNAAGRMDDMSVGIECLLAADDAAAAPAAAELDALNRRRRAVEAGMQESALACLERLAVDDAFSVSLYDPAWHQGVIGILASRIRERFHRPVIAFARGGAGELKGSGRSVPSLHLRDALDRVAKGHPGLIRRFGGHAAAAGLTIAEEDFGRFRDAFEEVAAALLSPEDLERVIASDGSLPENDTRLELAQAIADQVWGQGFPAPAFCDRFTVESQRVVGEKHLRLRLRRGQRVFEGMLFFNTQPLPRQLQAVYRLDVNEYAGASTLQLVLQHWEAA
ncbi:MAG TPA: single-stranded-DNA-specific exonuclease RecJ [Burkholderiales bacterium]|nr:single-stranded-DNA-specific exonuclease RecJ [Burkholderiales bacterium]